MPVKHWSCRRPTIRDIQRAKTMTPRKPLRFPLMALGMLALLTGMWAGLLRLGWNWPTPRPTFGLAHGPLMISGFLGTLIGVERAVALGRSWAFAAPALTALGAGALIAGVIAFTLAIMRLRRIGAARQGMLHI